MNFSLLVQKHPLFILLWTILSRHFPPFKKNQLLASSKQDISSQWFNPHWIFPQEKPEKRENSDFSSALDSYISYYLWRNSSWKYDGGIWTYITSFAISDNSSNMVPDMSYVATSQQRGFWPPSMDLSLNEVPLSSYVGAISKYEKNSRNNSVPIWSIWSRGWLRFCDATAGKSQFIILIIRSPFSHVYTHNNA